MRHDSPEEPRQASGEGKLIVYGFLQFGVPCQKNSEAVIGGNSRDACRLSGHN